jgi:large subunit ribosomal protein L29
MVAASELVVMDPDELISRLDESRKELFNLRFQLATGQLDNGARIGQVRRDVARILTVLRAREIEEAEGWQEPTAATSAADAADEAATEDPEEEA